MEWIQCSDRLPLIKGKYILKTKTIQGINRFDAFWNGKTWEISNQHPIAWLDESFL